MCELLVRESFLVQISTYYNYQKAMYIDSSFSIFNALCLLCVTDVFNCVCVCTILVTIRLHFQTSAYLIWARALEDPIPIDTDNDDVDAECIFFGAIFSRQSGEQWVQCTQCIKRGRCDCWELREC
jgi:hypothetical protein